jgi:hypothetical protein
MFLGLGSVYLFVFVLFQLHNSDDVYVSCMSATFFELASLYVLVSFCCLCFMNVCVSGFDWVCMYAILYVLCYWTLSIASQSWLVYYPSLFTSFLISFSLISSYLHLFFYFLIFCSMNRVILVSWVHLECSLHR